MINRVGNSGVAFKMNVRNNDMNSRDFEYQSEQIKNNPYLNLLDEKYNVDVTLGEHRMSVDCFEKPTTKIGKFAEKIGWTLPIFSISGRSDDRYYLEGTEGYWSRKKSALSGMAAHAVFKDYDETKDNEVWCWSGGFRTLPGDIANGLKNYGDRLNYKNKKSKNSVTNHEISPEIRRARNTLMDLMFLHYRQKNARYEAEYQKRVEQGDADKIEKGVTCNPSDYALAPGGCF